MTKRKSTSALDVHTNGKKKKLTVQVEEDDYQELESQEGELLNVFPKWEAKSDIRALGVDLGSSFTKIATISAFKDNTNNIRVNSNPTRFKKTSESNYTSSTLYYCDGKYSIFMKDLANFGVITLHTIKKLLTIQHLDTVVFEGVTFRVSVIMYQLIKCILLDACLDKLKVNFSYVLFTIPTGSSQRSKKIYRNCIMKAVKEVFPNTSIGMDNIMIIEEYRLLSLCRSLSIISTIPNVKKILMTDIGNLTVDSTCLERNDINKPFCVTYYGAEVSGTSLIHDIMNKYKINSQKLLSEMFSSDCKEITRELVPEKSVNLQTLESLIEKACKMMVNSIFEICLEKGIEHVVLFGAITGQSYFEGKFKKILSHENYERFVEDRKRYLNGNAKITKFETHVFPCQRTALIQGMQRLIEKGYKNNVALTHSTQLLPYQEVPGLVLLKKRKKRNMKINNYSNYISTKRNVTLNYIQDVELLVLKFRHTTNLKSFTDITKYNYEKVGLVDCERHLTLSIQFCKELEECYSEFEISVDLEENIIEIYYMVEEARMVKRFPFSRQLCVERVAINEILNILTQDESNEEVTWYGNSFRMVLPIGLGEGTACSLPVAKETSWKTQVLRLRK